MASAQVTASAFSPDTVALLRLLHAHAVRYLIVGGEAVIFYGHVRLTGDTDLLYDNTPGNCRALYTALAEFWEGTVPGLNSAAELEQPGLILQFGRPPKRIDLLNEIDAVSFTPAWENRTEVDCADDTGAFPIHYIGLDDLVANKRAVARAKDTDDLEFLESVDR